MKIRKQTKKWRTKDGRLIRICDMSDSHLVNTIQLIRKRRAELIYIYEEFLALMQTDASQDCMERRIDSFMNDFMRSFKKYIEPFYLEMQRRGIKGDKK